MAASSDLPTFDGSILEGGGQVIRQSIALGCILQKRVKIDNVRGKRSKPGLQRQHLTGVELVARMARGTLEGAQLDSRCVEFRPHGDGRGLGCFAGALEADTRSAGAVSLLLQVSLPCAFMSPSPTPVELLLRGGTNADMAPQTDYAEHVLLPTLRRCCGLEAALDVRQRGFFPRGRGEVLVRVNPVPHIPCFSLVDRGEVTNISVRPFVCNLDPDIAHRIGLAAQRQLKSFYPETPIEVTPLLDQKGVGPGTGVLIVATTSTGCLIAGSAIGAPGKESGVVGREAATMLFNNLERRGAVDEFLQDQLIIYMVLAKGRSVIRAGEITLHTETAIHFARAIAHVDISVDQQEDGTFLIAVEGLGFQNSLIGQFPPLPTPSAASPSSSHSSSPSPAGGALTKKQQKKQMQEQKRQQQAQRGKRRA